MRKIRELFDKPADYVQLSNKKGDYTFGFSIDNLNYKVYIQETQNTQAIVAAIESNSRINDKLNDISDLLNNKYDGISGIYEIHFVLDQDGEEKSNITDTGNSFEVFSTVASIFERELLHFDPQFILIISKLEESNRIRLYDLFTKRIEKRTNYSVLGKSEFSAPGVGHKHSFVMVRDNIYSDIQKL